MQNSATVKTISFFTEVEIAEAFQSAKQRQLPVLIDFWAPGCKGCKKMEITTYQHPEMLSYIDRQFVFVKYDITNREAGRLPSSPVLWTPTFIVFANDGSEVRKTTGYLSESQLKSELALGRAMAFLRKAQPQTTLDILEGLLAEPGHEDWIPEALYWAGVATYFLNKRSADSLIPYWGKLMRDHPGSLWSERADCLNIAL